MDGTLRDGEVVVGGDARQRLHDARGYGRPLPGGEVALAPVEAAHLLLDGHLDSVDGMDLPDLLAAVGGDGLARRLAVYADLRERGFYLSPARPAWLADGVDASPDAVNTATPDAGDAAPAVDLVVYRSGTEPREGEVAHRVVVVGERERVPAATLGDVALAVADDEGAVSYFETGRPEPGGATRVDLPTGLPALVLDDRVLVRDHPPDLYERGFYGQPLRVDDPNRDLPEYLQLSLTEAAYLADRGAIAVEGSPSSVHEAGRALAGDRFDRRLAAYAALRDADVAPKTGFKFGADFRTYDAVGTVSDLGHSERLVRVLPADHQFSPRGLALDVRMAGGVRKEMHYALVDPAGDVAWLSAGRLRP